MREIIIDGKKTEVKIPRCMSTQHPDNVMSPFFTENSELGGEDEIREAYYAFSHLGISEQMWDCEGKEVDTFVVKKLLTRYESYFRQNQLGKDVFLTLRVPNPTVEKTEAKILLETLESIPRSFDSSKLFYGQDIAPIFEVILPMTSSAKCLSRVWKYYREFVVGKKSKTFADGDIKISDWIGDFMPESVNVIPLFEDMENMLRSSEIVKTYLQDKNIEHQRVFLARSDPAMNYGIIGAVVLNKIALQNFAELEKTSGVRLYPIIGAGSAPFRGDLKPHTVENVMQEYPSAYTFTLQSAFKYDFAPEAVEESVKKLQANKVGKPHQVDAEKSLELLERYSAEYQKQMLALAPLINATAKFVPGRRKRKLHTGLFGYSRNLGAVSLPRVITFTAALYSVGVPPEILGINALSNADIEFLKKVYLNFDLHMRSALAFFNPDNNLVPKELVKRVKELWPNVEMNAEHASLSTGILAAINNRSAAVTEMLVRAAHIRQFLG